MIRDLHSLTPESPSESSLLGQRRHWLTWAGGILLLAGFAVLAVLLADAGGSRLPAESIYHLFGAISPAESQAIQDVSRMTSRLTWRYGGNGDVPPSSWSGIFTPQEQQRYLDNNQGLPSARVMAGVDPWGRKYRYECVESTVEPNYFYLKIYSCGGNGVDEGGAGDDIGNSFDIDIGTRGARGEASRKNVKGDFTAYVVDDAAVGTFIDHIHVDIGGQPAETFRILNGNPQETFRIEGGGNIFL